MQISTFVPTFILIFLRYLFACELSFTFWDSDTVAFLIMTTVVIPDMELGHWVTGSMGHLGHLSRPGHRVTGSSF